MNKFFKTALLLFYIWLPLSGAVAETAPGTSPSGFLNVKTEGAKGDGRADDTEAIENAMATAFSTKSRGVYFPKGTYLIKQLGVDRGIIKLLNGVSLKGSGRKNCHIVLSAGRVNPLSLFYQEWHQTPAVSNVIIEGIDFDGNIRSQKFDAAYQFCHGLSINNGQNITVKNCKFQGFRGDGLLFGDTFETSLNLRLVTNVSVHDNEFTDIYREGTMFCCVNGAEFYNNYVHGEGYLVAGVDIERHGPNETVRNVSVHNNTFRFNDGFGPVERGRIARYRRAVSIGYFYDGYKDGVADSLSGNHQVFNNLIYQGQIDCFGHINVSIADNKILNNYENITGVKFVSPPAINVSDAGKTSGLKNVSVTGNYIDSAIPGNGITFYNYTGVSAVKNTLKGGRIGKVSLVEAAGDVSLNSYK